MATSANFTCFDKFEEEDFSEDFIVRTSGAKEEEEEEEERERGEEKEPKEGIEEMEEIAAS